jgi:hypothetical protein
MFRMHPKCGQSKNFNIIEKEPIVSAWFYNQCLKGFISKYPIFFDIFNIHGLNKFSPKTCVLINFTLIVLSLHVLVTFPISNCIFFHRPIHLCVLTSSYLIQLSFHLSFTLEFNSCNSSNILNIQGYKLILSRGFPRFFLSY